MPSPPPVVPDRLGPAARVRRRAQAGAADRDDVRGGRRVDHAVVRVARRGGDDVARVAEVLRVEAGVGGCLRSAPGVGDVAGQAGGGVLGGVEAGAAVAGRLDQDDVALGADRGGHVEVERLFEGPVVAGRGLGGQRGGRAGLVDLLEARDGGQARGRAVGGQVAGGGRVVVGVNDRDGAAGAVGGGGRGQGVGRLQLGGAVAEAGRDGVRRDARGHRVDAVPLKREAGLLADDDHGRGRRGVKPELAVVRAGCEACAPCAASEAIRAAAEGVGVAGVRHRGRCASGRQRGAEGDGQSGHGECTIFAACGLLEGIEGCVLCDCVRTAFPPVGRRGEIGPLPRTTRE